MRLAPASALLLALAFASSAALAESAAEAPGAPATASSEPKSATALIVIVADEPGDAASSRLERDLRSLGFAVTVLGATPENSSALAALERTARGLGGIAAIHLLAGARGSELWLLEPATGQTVTRSLSGADASSADPAELALGTLELLRASMVELHPRPRPLAESSSAPRPESVTASPARPPFFSLSGAVAAELGLRSVGPSLSTLWGAWLRVGGCFGARGFAALPVLSESEQLPEGRVEVAPLLLGAGLSCSLASSDARLWPRVSLGVATAHVVTRGTAIDPTRSSSGAAWLGGGYAMLGLGLRVARRLHVNLDATGVVLPTPALIVASQREVGSWGGPGSFISLGVEVLTGAD